MALRQGEDLVLHLSELLRRPVLDRQEDRVGRVIDAVIRLSGEGYPAVSGFLVDVGGREVFLHVEQVDSIDGQGLRLEQERLDLRRFERRKGEVLLRRDVLGHRLIDVRTGRFVRARDIELVYRSGRWRAIGVDTRPRRLIGALGRGSRAPSADWKAFEPLIGSASRLPAPGRFRRLRRLRPGQLADLLEEASQAEGEDILGAVHQDPELEADVFEELDAEHQLKFLESRDDDEVAAVISHMRPDDAADLVAELDQDRREQVLGLLPEPMKRKVRRLLGFNPTSAGGLMSTDLLSVTADSIAGDVLERVRVARDLPPEALIVVYVVDGDGVLVGAASLIQLLQADPGTTVVEISEPEPVRVRASADIVEVALLMTDYNLSAIPVVDEEHRLVGLITVDDVLEEILPEEWRRREQGIPVESGPPPSS